MALPVLPIALLAGLGGLLFLSKSSSSSSSDGRPAWAAGLPPDIYAAILDIDNQPIPTDQTAADAEVTAIDAMADRLDAQYPLAAQHLREDAGKIRHAHLIMSASSKPGPHVVSASAAAGAAANAIPYPSSEGIET